MRRRARLPRLRSTEGGGWFGGGGSTSVTGIAATNVVQSEARASITDSDVTTTTGGDVTVSASNTATIDATAVNASTSGGTAVGVTLAFNSIGWEAQNILFNAIDTIIGDPAIADAFGADTGAGATAYLLDTEVDAAGAVNVLATAGASLTASIDNRSDSDASCINVEAEVAKPNLSYYTVSREAAQQLD